MRLNPTDSVSSAMEGSRSSGAHILIAEDNPGDIRLMREALRESRITGEVDVTRDGVETLDFLHRRGPYAQAARPVLLLLDLSMPRKDGRQVLAEIKADPDLRRIPVVIMTSSPSEDDVLRAYENHANCYVRKPTNFEQLRGVIRQIESFWFTVVILPRH